MARSAGLAGLAGLAGVAALVAGGLLLATGCSGPQARPGESPAAESRHPTTGPSIRSPTPQQTSPSGAPHTAAPAPSFRGRTAMHVVAWLARRGPRQATSGSYRHAARFVERRLRGMGYDVSRQPVRVPAGVSWGVPVPAGTSWNIVAAPPGLRPGTPQLLVGAHLDTVPQSPGADDNASGVAVLLELARMARQPGARTRLPTTFVVFAAEEPRGPTDADHHYGSRAYVSRLSRHARLAVGGMLALDRVGVGAAVPVCSVSAGRDALRTRVLGVARSVGVRAYSCLNTGSDHESFAEAGIPAARIGGNPYAAYHSAADRLRVVDPRQLRRSARLVWAWLTR